jgi:GntR family transcriptional regulator
MQRRETKLLSATRERAVARAVTIAQNVGTASVVEWAKLALRSPRARVLRAARVRYEAPGCPIAFEEVVLPLDRFPCLAANGGEVPDLTELAQRYALSLAKVAERISIIQAPRDVALHLGIAAGTDVMKLNRVAETVDGEPIEWRVTFRKL